ncbi:uncharacterized protein LOC131429082 [Malaya genurostris]|uniref:uncharacterized protein LOC131429082 n=1 Tax=Malaya genurostris TaxID=325434 RepID=UPI0026F3D31A|nr:uncharacterized protein LOC131429082 [Malaya genurostris]
MAFGTVFCPTQQQTIHVILLTFTIFGFIPFKIDSGSLRVCHSQRNRSLFTFKWIIGTSVFYTAEIIVAIIFHESVFFSGFVVGWINDMLKYSSEVLAIYVTIVEVISQKNTQLQIFERLAEFGTDRSHVGILNVQQYSKFCKQYSIKFFMYVGVTLIMELKLVIGVMSYNRQWVNIWSFSIFVLAFGRLRSLYFIFYIDLIRAQLTSVRERLTELVALMHWAKTFSRHSNEYYQTVDEVSKTLLFLKNCYGEIWLMTMNVNSVIGWSMCFNLLSSFVQVSCDMYWFYLTIHDKAVDGYEELFLSMCPSPIMAVMLLYSAEACLDVADSMGPLLHEIPKCGSVKLYNIVYRFSNHISQHPIRFSAHSLTEINYKLLKLLITGITTYMLIFIPFSSNIPNVGGSDATQVTAPPCAIRGGGPPGMLTTAPPSNNTASPTGTRRPIYTHPTHDTILTDHPSADVPLECGLRPQRNSICQYDQDQEPKTRTT